MVINSKTKLYLEVGFSVFVVVLIFVLIFVFAFNPSSELSGDFCEGKIVSSQFDIDACFDTLTKNIFLDVRRGSFTNYPIDSIDVFFIEDNNENNLNLSDVVLEGEFRTYNIASEKKPNYLDLSFYFGDGLNNSCIEEKRIYVTNCVRDVDDSSPDLINNSNNYFSYNEEYWRNICASDWSCSNWGECLGGIERRDCVDINNCVVPTDIPKRNRYCSSTCVEDWSCTWSSCSEGYSEPTCTDLNNCGTEYNKPKKAICSLGADCTPSISCGEWSSCNVDYSFTDYESRLDFSNIEGSRTRVCRDSNSCVGDFIETDSCLTNIDTYSKKVEICGDVYLEIYSSLGDELLARLYGFEEGVSPRIILGEKEINC